MVDNEVREKLIEIEKILDNKEIYVVGGAIRDTLLGRRVEDVDIVIMGIDAVDFFRDKGIGFPVVLDRELDEIRLIFRKNKYIDIGGEKRSIEENLFERDFTINAMAMPLRDFLEGNLNNIIDPTGGMEDLKRRRLRRVREDSIRRDRLRVLRGFRFILYYGLTPEYDFLKESRITSFSGVAGERIRYELLRIMEHPSSSRVVPLMVHSGIFTRLFPESEPLFRDKELTRHSLRTYIVLERLMKGDNYLTRISELKDYLKDKKKIPLLKLASLFHDIGKPYTRTEKGDQLHFYGHDTLGSRMMREMMEILRFSTKEIDYVSTIIKRHMHLHLLATAPELTERAIRRYFRILGELAYPLMFLTYADGYATAGRVKHIEETIDRMILIRRADLKKMSRKRIITGYDLIELGIPRGPIYKKILEEVEDLYLEGKLKTKQECIEWIKENYFLRIKKS